MTEIALSGRAFLLAPLLSDTISTGFLEVLDNALALPVSNAKIELGACVSLLRGLAIPVNRFHAILGDSIAAVVGKAKPVLRACVSLLCGFAIPVNSFDVVLAHSLATVVSITEPLLG